MMRIIAVKLSNRQIQVVARFRATLPSSRSGSDGIKQHVKLLDP